VPKRELNCVSFAKPYIAATLNLFTSTAPSLKPCPRASKNVNQCIIDAIEIAKPYLANGNFSKEIRIDPLEPLKMGNLKVDKGVKMEMSNLMLRGLTNFTVQKVRTTFDPFKVS